MPSQLDRQMNAIMDRITAPDGPLPVGTIERNGIVLPVFRDAPASLPALFDHYCARHGQAQFLVDGEIRLSFTQTLALARRVATSLVTSHGVKRGDPVGLAAHNSANWIIAYMGILMAGGCVVLLNGWWTGPELAEGTALAGCALVIADPQRAARLEEQGRSARIVVIDHGDPATGLAPLLGGPAPLPAVSGDDLATIAFTSGSTGEAKGAVSDHRALVQATLNFAAQSLMIATLLGLSQDRSPQPATLVNVPLFHVTGEVAVLLQSIVLGRRLVIMPRWDAREAMRLIEREKIDSFVGVPLMSQEIATHPERDRFDLTTCRYFAAGGAARPPEHVARLRSAFPHAFPLLGYGLTETNSVGCGNLNENYLDKPASTGPASRPLVEIAILDEAGNRLPPGAAGEVAIRSICNVLGYWRDEQATRTLLRDGWLLTGDVGHLDEDGYLFIVGRQKEIIIRGGENIACAEVERTIYAHPAIAEACVFSLPDAIYGEVPAAVYRIRAGQALDEAELRRFLGERLAAFKIPARFWQSSEPLPRLGTEKVDRRALKERYSNPPQTATTDVSP